MFYVAALSSVHKFFPFLVPRVCFTYEPLGDIIWKESGKIKTHSVNYTGGKVCSVNSCACGVTQMFLNVSGNTFAIYSENHDPFKV
jgi:hypothetical protein